MQRSTIDVCLYTYHRHNTILWCCIYVDDALLIDNDADTRARFVHDLSARFPTEDKGELEWILNVAITRDRKAHTISMDQSLYVSDLLTKFEMYAPSTHTRTYDSPAEEGLLLSADDQPKHDTSEWHDMAPYRAPYMSIEGGLLWLTNLTYPEL